MGWDGNYFRDQSARKERKEERKGAVLFIEFSKVGKPISISYYTYRSLRGTYTIIYYITKKGNGN